MSIWEEIFTFSDIQFDSILYNNVTKIDFNYNGEYEIEFNLITGTEEFRKYIVE